MMKYLSKLSPFAYISIYFVVHLPWLVGFPFVHSDEAWLGGLTRNMLANGSIGCTEPFFDAKERYPHAIKTLFHLVQGVFISIFDYSPFTLRLISLIVGCACLLILYFCALKMFSSRLLAFCAMALLSVDVQFIYAAHFARNEIFILLSICLCIYFLTRGTLTTPTVMAYSIATGIAIFVHPNSFLIGCACGCAILFRCIMDKNKFKPLIIYCGVTACFAALAVGISYMLDHKFLPHYFAYGQEEFGLWAGVGDRLTGIGGFFSRLWAQQGGTYYLPNIQLSLILFIASASLCLIFAIIMRKEQPKEASNIFTLLCFELGLILGLVIMGRFNQTYIIFLYPACVLMTAMACRIILAHYESALIALCIFALAASSTMQIKNQLEMPSYAGFTSQLKAAVPNNEKTLGNLNSGFYFDNDALLDYRNLPYAVESGTVEDYIEKNKIKYIIYSSELDFIYENRPYYNVIYGNAMFVPQLKEFCQNSCTQIGSFTSLGYGARIVSIIGDPRYSKVTIYKVK